MKCVKCGAELKEGCIYCSVCGHESRIEPDYSVLEDDYLRALLKQEEDSREIPPQKEKNVTAERNKPDSSLQKKKSSKNNKSNKTPIIVVCCILAAAIIAGVAVKVSIDHRNANSYEYQVEQARKEAVDLNYEKALNYYKTALSIKPDDVEARMAMTEIYMAQKDYDSAMVLLIEVVELDKANKDAYKKLIEIYEKKEDYDSIAELASGISDTGILELFDGYIVAEPVISMEEGEYDKPFTVTLFSVDEDDIYYTTDGSTPDVENGIRYRGEEIEYNEDGIHELRVVACNEKGIYSPVVSATYRIEFAPPEYPTVTPDGGRLTEETLVTITAEENCSIYYTWDGTDPTTASEQYEIPLVIPDGNNILSVLVVNEKTGLDSGVYRTNFIYYR